MSAERPQNRTGEPRTPRLGEPHVQPWKAHPRTQELVTYLQDRAESGIPVPAYSALSELFDMNRITISRIIERAGLKGKLHEINKSPEDIFAPSKETAWFLGTLFSTHGGSNTASNEIFLRTPLSDSALLQTFRNTGESLLSTDRKKNRGIEQETGDKNILVFHDSAMVRALGNFTPKERVKTLQNRHKWTTEHRYLPHFFSGVIDAGAVINQDKGSISFFSTEHETNEFLLQLLQKIDVRAIPIKGRKHLSSGIIIQRPEEIRKLAAVIECKSTLKRDGIKEIAERERKKKKYGDPTSVTEIVEEWERLKTLNKGKSMSSSKIRELYHKEETLFPPSIYIDYFCDPEKGRRFAPASDRLNEIVALPPEEREKIIAPMKLRSGFRIEKEAVIAEWQRVLAHFGRVPERKEVRELYLAGETLYDGRLYARYFGERENGGPSFPLAAERLAAILAEEQSHTNEQIIFSSE